MDRFVKHTGLVVPLDRSNVDTDAIIPKQFLKSIKRSGFGPNAFDEWRYMDHGEPGMDNSSRPRNPNFVLNLDRYQGATILLARANFGCGSSREHAPWALQDYGFKAVIAESFADIFFNNCFKIGLLPIVCSKAELNSLFGLTEQSTGYTLTIDLENQLLVRSDGHVVPFDIDAFRKKCLLNGWDDIGLTLLHEQEIREFESKRKLRQPWLFS
ncbi:MAG: 3-isopropylmalate dehydratase small subunit [Rhodocyclaceae bacterium]|jgi:3-isopropylmalate/(R)-2-methylmalate dehydratase small subunit|nr:3-isopropylmalate dehydratase small subunit [Rhodocyclaceae bacterium]